MADPSPVAFMSYTHVDDKSGEITTLHQRLSDEVRIQTGENFQIFQDVEGVKLGQDWRRRIEDSLDEVTFLIPILTPSFFKSDWCRKEVLHFHRRETALGRDDLILPIYFVSTSYVDDPTKRETDEVATIIATHQYADWRQPRVKGWTSPDVTGALVGVAMQIRDALERVLPPRPTAADRPRTTTPRRRRSQPGTSAASTVEKGPREEAQTEPASRSLPSGLEFPDGLGGLERVYPSLQEAWGPIVEALATAKRRLALVGISHSANLNRDGFERAIKQFLSRPNTELDVLFLDPQSDAIEQRARAENTNPKTFRDEVVAGVDRVSSWKTPYSTNVRLFYYDAYPVWRLEKVDDDLMFVHPYPPGSRGMDAVVMRLRRVESTGSLFAAFDSILERLRTGSKPVPEAPVP